MTDPKTTKKDAKKDFSAEELAKINKLLGAIDTDAGIKGGVEDISNQEMEELSSILFPDNA